MGGDFGSTAKGLGASFLSPIGAFTWPAELLHKGKIGDTPVDPFTASMKASLENIPKLLKGENIDNPLGDNIMSDDLNFLMGSPSRADRKQQQATKDSLAAQRKQRSRQPGRTPAPSLLDEED